MKSDFTNALAEFVLRANPELTYRFEDQAEALNEYHCTYPDLGSWVDAHDVKYLLSTLALNDKDFGEKFPGMEKLTQDDRKKLIETFETHFEHCTHCSLKRGYDLELDNRIKLACEQNDQALLKLLQDDEGDLSEDGDHENLKARSAHQ